MKNKQLKLIDSHAHLDSDKYDHDRDELINSFADNHILKVITIADSYQSAEKVYQLINQYDCLYGAVGFHPHNASEILGADIERLKPMFQCNKIVAVGEIGLDYYYTFSTKEKQKWLFRKMLDLSLEIKKPVIIHNRNSDQDFASTISSNEYSDVKGVIHCFDSNIELAKKCLDLGYFISFSGMITFKKADELREVVKYVPLSKMLIETDSPYLAPHPNRGKRNTPLNVKYVAEAVAAIKNIDINQVASITKDNVYSLFKISE